MNKTIGLLVAGLTLVLASTASAGPITTAPVECGTVASASGSVAFSTSTSFAGGTASTSGGVGTITCNGFTVPAGATLIGITATIGDSATGALNAASQITQTWTYSGELLAPTPFGSESETSTGGAGPTYAFGTCSGSGALVCGVAENFSTSATYSNGQTTGDFSFNVTPTVTGGGGAGVAASGLDSANVFISFTYTSTSSTPEPGSVLLIGSGLIGLGLFARRGSAAR